MKKFFKVLGIVLSAAMMLTACGTDKGGNDNVTIGNTDSYPIETNAVLSYWMALSSSVSATCNDMGDTPFAKALQEQTGIGIEYTHPSSSGVAEQFSIMLSSGTLPDIIEYNWYGFAGGPQSAIDDGYIIPLNDLIDKYAPNYKAYLEKNPELDAMVKTEEGLYYSFPFVRGDDILKTASGPFVRQDWLDELGLQAPETIEDWENMLTAFRDKKSATAPFTGLATIMSSTSIFAGAYGVCDTFYLEDGKVVFGPMQEGYRDYLTTMNRWYAKGLIDQNFASIDNKTFESNMLSGKSGAAVGMAGSGLGKFAEAGTEIDSGYKLTGVKYPSLNKGEQARFGQREWMYSVASSAAISTSCKNPELAVRLLDYAYSEEGTLLYNYGIEGESYNMVDGYPTYTDKVLKNPDGLSISNALALYARASNSGPFIQQKPYIEQYYTLQEQKDAVNEWLKTDNVSYALPLLAFTSEESAELAKIITDVNTYYSESKMQFIMGVKSLDEFDAYVSSIKNFDIDRAIEIYQAAYDRYQANK